MLQDFPDLGWGANQKGGGVNLLFMSTFSKKMHKIGGKLDREGGHVSLPPVTFGSANDFLHFACISTVEHAKVKIAL